MPPEPKLFRINFQTAGGTAPKSPDAYKSERLIISPHPLKAVREHYEQNPPEGMKLSEIVELKTTFLP